MSSELTSNIAWSDKDNIYVRGQNLCADLLGNTTLTGFLVLELTGRQATTEEIRMLDALMVSVAEHGITPSVIAARLTLLGAPEALQGAMAAGLLGAGDRYLGTSDQTAKMLADAWAAYPNGTEDDVARYVVEAARQDKRQISGVGHPIHRDGDPRAARLSEIAEELGFFGRNSSLLFAIAKAATEILGKPLPVNGAGIVGAIALDMGLDPRVIRGLGVIARSVGLVGHLMEEMNDPMGATMWHQISAATHQA